MFVATDDAAIAFDVDDGSEQWRYDGARPAIPPEGVGEENVYALHLNGEGFAALDPASGAESWQSSVPGFPLISDGTVFVGDDTLHAFSTGDGTTRWTFDVTEGVSGLAPTPDVIFVGSTGQLYAVRRADGSERWRFDQPDASKWRRLRPVRADAETSQVLVWDDGERTLRSFHADDASERWRYDVDTRAALFRGVVTEKSAIVVEATDIVAVDLADGTERWRFSASAELSPRLSMTEDAVVARSDHRVYCVSVDDGVGRWTFDATRSMYSIAVDGDVIHATTIGDSGFRRIIRVSGRDGSLRWVANRRGQYLHTLAEGGRVYVGTESGLELLTPPSDLVGVAERFLANNRIGVLAGGVALAAAAAISRHFSWRG